jgi:DNA-directed RNA polymerase subunit RPC12/RpoP
MIKGLRCPHCKTERLNKFGISWSGRNKRQRYVCLDCHRSTIVPMVNKEEAEVTVVDVITSAVEDNSDEATA